MSKTLSVVFGTLNRIEYLKRCIESIRKNTKLSYQIVVTDGGSEDGSIEFLKEQEDVYLVEHGHRRGAICAFNDAFSVARGKYVANINDDTLIVGNCFDRAVEQMERGASIGQVAIPFADPGKKPRLDVMGIGNPTRVLRYANFGVTKRTLGESVGWWGTRYNTYAGDNELSAKIWDAGYRVADLDGEGYIQHFCLQDSTRVENLDSHKFYGYWRSWVGPRTSR